MYPFGTDIEPPHFWLSRREGVCGSQRLCCPAAAGSWCAPLPGSPWGKSALALSVLLVRFVLHQRAAPRDMCACMASFQVPPSPPHFQKSSTFCWYVPVAEGCQPRRCPCSPCCSMGLLDAMAASLLCWSITACRLSVWWHRWQVTFRMLLWVTGGVKSTDEPRLDILLLL